jgi:hypothetical protein
MSPLPTPSRLPLASAVQRIARASGVSPLAIELLDAICGALCDGDLTAYGSEEDRDGTITRPDHEIPASVWRSMAAQHFRERYISRRVGLYDLGPAPALSAERFIVNLTLDTAQIEQWMTASESECTDSRKAKISESRQQSTPRRARVGKHKPYSKLGPRPSKRLGVEEEMKAQIADGHLTPKALADEKEEVLSAQYKVNRDTVYKAIHNALKQRQ